MPLIGAEAVPGCDGRALHVGIQGLLARPAGLVAVTLPGFRPGHLAAGGSESPTAIGRAIFVPRHSGGSAQPRQSSTQKFSFSLLPFKTRGALDQKDALQKGSGFEVLRGSDFPSLSCRTWRRARAMDVPRGEEVSHKDETGNRSAGKSITK